MMSSSLGGGYHAIMTLRDHVWLWCHLAVAHTRRTDQYGLPGRSTITPIDAAAYLDISNALMVRYDGEPQPPYAGDALPLTPLKRVIWSVEGGGGGDVDAVLQLA